MPAGRLFVGTVLALVLAPGAAAAWPAWWGLAGSYDVGSTLVPSCNGGGELLFWLSETTDAPEGVATFVFDGACGGTVSVQSRRVSECCWALYGPGGLAAGWIGEQHPWIEGIPFRLELPHATYAGQLDQLLF